MCRHIYDWNIVNCDVKQPIYLYLPLIWWRFYVVTLLFGLFCGGRGFCHSTESDLFKFSVLKLVEIVILWVYYTILFGFNLFWHVWEISFQLLTILFWLRITDEGSVPEMRIWSILLIQSDLKWCIHLSRSLFLYFNYLVSLLVDQWVPEGTCSQVLRSTLVDS